MYFSDPVFQCPKCEMVFGDDEVLQKHLKSKHPDRSVRKKFSCDHPSCDYSTDDKSNLNRHLAAHTGKRLFKCNYHSCRKDFSRKDVLKRHIKTVHEKKEKYTCIVCSKAFTRKCDLVRHKKEVHDKEKFQVCRYCGGRFGRRETCTGHEQTCVKKPTWRPRE